MRTRAKAKVWTKEVGAHFEKELMKMQRMNPQVAEYSVQRNYLDLFWIFHGIIFQLINLI